MSLDRDGSAADGRNAGQRSVIDSGDSYPRVGMLAVLRNRRGLVASVDPYDGNDGTEYLVTVEYTDTEGEPQDTVLWSRECGATLLQPHAVPRVVEEAPMPGADFDALVRASRWSSLIPFLSPSDDTKRSELPISAPFFGAVQVDDFQLVPLLRALQMPRVSLLLADDVGLGKTIEAGLILTELLVRRRIRRVLILTPASLKRQWAQEMKDKFALTFDVIDRDETYALQKRIGLDANPWRTYPRIISSYHYFRQPDILEQFLATCRRKEGTGLAHLPWDLLIVDEAHNLMPAAYGDDSDLSKMLRHISPYFEHKLFLTATPHNGHTRSFSGLLELLDPVRYTQTSEFSEDEKQRIATETVVRRLKSEINALDGAAGRPPRFAERFLKPEPLYTGKREQALSAAVEEFRRAIKAQIAQSKRSEQLAGNFAIEVLTKRLLSCPATFAESWYRFRAGTEESEEVDAAQVNAAGRAASADLDDDLELEGRVQHAARTVGAWMRPFLDALSDEIAAIDNALEALGLTANVDGTVNDPKEDARLERLFGLIDEQLRTQSGWRDEERLIVFTEYKTTLDYLEQRVKEKYSDDGTVVRILYGGTPQREKQRSRSAETGPIESREEIKAAFNDPDSPVRVLIATDAASEGLNLQETARLLLHYDIPWNPARLDQRNGRLDRHGQARDVFVHHFTSDDDADLRFIGRVVTKAHEMREDLGSLGELFDAAFERRFEDLEDVDSITETLDRDVETAKGRAEVPHEDADDTGREEAEHLEELKREIDLSPESLRDTLEIALGINMGHPRLDSPDSEGRMRLANPLPHQWKALIDDSLRLESGASRGPLPTLVFDPAHFIHETNGRRVFRPSKDTALLHLGHPMFRHALALFARARFPGGGEGELSPSRWIVRRGVVPTGADALLVLTLEELAVNELREPFHHWLRAVRFPVVDGGLGDPLPHLAASESRPSDVDLDTAAIDQARDLWDELRIGVESWIKDRQETLTQRVADMLAETGEAALEAEKERFQNRIKEVRAAMRENTLKRLERERDKLLEDMKQLPLLNERRREQEEQLRNLEEELRLRSSRYEALLERLQSEQTRTLEEVLPKRFMLRGAVQVFPVTVEIRLPEASS